MAAPHDTPPRSPVGRTALVAVVPEADPVVGEWRAAYDPVAAQGVPSHVSVLYPFLDLDLIDRQVIGELSRVLAAHRPFDVRFTKSGRWPGVLYLVPEPDAPLRELTASVVAGWPGTQPYGGRFGPDPQPHLTIGQGQDPAVYDPVETALAGRLPITGHVDRVLLVAYDGTRWQQHTVFPLTGQADGSPSPTTGVRGGPRSG